VPEASFVHLHARSEYSILDGSCRIRALVARAAEFEVGLTDHGSMAGAIELYRETEKQGRQAAPRPRGLHRRRPSRPNKRERAPHAPRRRQHQLLERDQALLDHLPRGLLLQAARRLARLCCGLLGVHGVLPARAQQARSCGPTRLQPCASRGTRFSSTLMSTPSTRSSPHCARGRDPGTPPRENPGPDHQPTPHGGRSCVTP
jgi:PHP domain